MKKHTSLRSIALLVLAGTMVWMAGAGTAVSKDPGRPEAAADPYAGRTVLVEAFVVQMNASVLAEMGVSPLGREPDTVTAEGILARLQTGGGATVLRAMRTAGIHATRRSQAGETKTTYRPKRQEPDVTRPPRPRGDYTSHRDELTISVENPVILSDRAVHLGYSFQYTGDPDRDADTDVWPTSVSWSWNSEVSLQIGKPRIVGGTQDGETAVFLILTAHVLD
jgi:hypothetical protein